MQPMTKKMVIDVESVGLHGEGFAVGWVVLADGGDPRQVQSDFQPRYAELRRVSPRRIDNMDFRDLNFAHAKLNPAINLLEIFTPPNEDGTGQVTPPQYIRIHGHGWLRELASLLAPYATAPADDWPAGLPRPRSAEARPGE